MSIWQQFWQILWNDIYWVVENYIYTGSVFHVYFHSKKRLCWANIILYTIHADDLFNILNFVYEPLCRHLKNNHHHCFFNIYFSYFPCSEILNEINVDLLNYFVCLWICHSITAHSDYYLCISSKYELRTCRTNPSQ